MAAVYGPVLPPHLAKKQQQEKKKISEDVENEENVEVVHKPKLIGPRLPNQELGVEAADLSLEGRDAWNPESPAYMLSTNEDSNMIYTIDNDAYGPMPAGTVLSSKSQIDLEERAIQLKIDQLKPKEPEPATRESWMLDCPDLILIGPSSGSRQFRARGAPEMDRAGWTATPSSKEKTEVSTADIRAEARLRAIKRRDDEQEDIATKYRRKEPSLQEIHKKRLEQAEKEDLQGPVRKPFNRETDMAVPRLENARTIAILKKTDLLSNNFASGCAKYL